MHPTNFMPRRRPWLILLGIVLGGMLAWPAAAQEGPPPAVVIVPINGNQLLQMKNKQLIKTVQNQNREVAHISPIQSDPSKVLVTGISAGTTRVTLTDMENKAENYDIVVQLDVAFLRKVLQDSVPTANVTPIPVGSSSIILTGTVARAEDIPIVVSVAQSVTGGMQLVSALRVGGVQQVELCVSVARVSRSQMRQMSFNFVTASTHTVFASTLGQSLNFANSFSAPLNAAASATGTPGNLFLGVINPNHAFFGWLEALRNEGLTKILAEPKVVTISGRPASFLDGGEQAIPVPAGLGQIGVQFEEFGTRLNVLPIVLGNGKIHLEVEPEVSSLDPAAGTSIGGTVVPGRDTQRVHTTVELESGQTFAIGGLIQRRVGGTATKIPVLGDIPFAGALFRGVQYTQEEDELLILVTPNLVDPLACNQVPKYRPGEETRIPDDFELFLEGILEAPRGPRETCPNGHYQAAWKNGPTANDFPCGGNDCGSRGFCDCYNPGNCHACTLNGSCVTGGCGNNGCGNGSTCASGACLGQVSSERSATAQTPATVPNQMPIGAVAPAPVSVPKQMPVTVPVQTPAPAPVPAPAPAKTAPAGPTSMRPAYETVPLSPSGDSMVQEAGFAAPANLPPTYETPPVEPAAPAANFGAVAGSETH